MLTSRAGTISLHNNFTVGANICFILKDPEGLHNHLQINLKNFE